MPILFYSSFKTKHLCINNTEIYIFSWNCIIILYVQYNRDINLLIVLSMYMKLTILKSKFENFLFCLCFLMLSWCLNDAENIIKVLSVSLVPICHSYL